MQAINNALAGLNRSLTNILANPYVSTALIVFALVFASLAAPNLPPFMINLFDNTLFKIFYLFLILVLLQYNVVIALIAALAFVLALQSLQRYRTFSYAQDQRSNYALTGQVPTALTAATEFLGTAKDRVGNFLGNVGNTTYDVGRDIVNVPGQVFTGVGDVLSSIPSAFSTPLGSASYGSEVLSDSLASSGCPIPLSCQNTCGGQPMEPTALPPVENTEVSGICSLSCDSEGPQGLRFPPGYENLGMGYDINGPLA